MTDAPGSNIAKQLVTEVSGLWWLPLIRGIVLLILGCYALFRPGMTLAAYTQVAGFFLVMDGVFAIIAGVLGRSRRGCGRSSGELSRYLPALSYLRIPWLSPD